MKDFREFQFGWLIFVFLIPVQALIVFLYMNKIGSRPMDSTSVVLINIVLVLPYFLFYGLTTTIAKETIIVSFGIGLIKKKILLTRVTAVEKVINPWYYGWGIRIIPKGMMYNISGAKAVELRFNDTTRVFRIGTKDSVRLQEEIKKRLT